MYQPPRDPGIKLESPPIFKNCVAKPGSIYATPSLFAPIFTSGPASPRRLIVDGPKNASFQRKSEDPSEYVRVDAGKSSPVTLTKFVVLLSPIRRTSL